MRERLIGVSHAVDVFAAAYGGTFAVEGGDEFIRQFLGGWPALFFADRHQDPANRQRLLPGAIDLHRYLVRRPADALATDFDRWLHVLESLREHFDRLLIRHALPHDFK